MPAAIPLIVGAAVSATVPVAWGAFAATLIGGAASLATPCVGEPNTWERILRQLEFRVISGIAKRGRAWAWSCLAIYAAVVRGAERISRRQVKNAELLQIASILHCPISGSDLSLVRSDSLAQLRARIARGEFSHAAGTPVQMQIEVALSSADGEFIYPVIDGILVLLPGLAIVRAGAAPHYEIDTAGVMQFYDDIGWHVTKDGKFEDTQRFEDVREVSRTYVHASYMRVRSHIPRRGKYLLDVACGPIPYPEYVTYSEEYDKRLCVDFSIVALRAAKERLGDKGIYIQGDITRLPLKDATVDGFISLHTIYHVPAEKQGLAFKELERVLKSDGSGVVVYTWGSSLAMEILMNWVRPTYAAKWLLKKILPTTLVNRLKKISSPRTHGEDAQSSGPPNTKREAELYFHPHNYAWFQREVASSPGWDVRVWRVASVPFLRRYVHPGFIGRGLVSLMLYIENAFPRMCGKFGQYPMMVYAKAEEQAAASEAVTVSAAPRSHTASRGIGWA